MQLIEADESNKGVAKNKEQGSTGPENTDDEDYTDASGSGYQDQEDDDEDNGADNNNEQ